MHNHADHKIRFYVGGFAMPGEDGVRAYAFDPISGHCMLTAACSSLRNPSYLLRHPRKDVLYAVEEVQPEGSLVALSTGGTAWQQLCALPSGGAGPCHLALSPDARFLLVSHYAGGCLSVFELDDNGVPVRMSDFIQHAMTAQDAEGVIPTRQESAHIHFALCDGERVFVNDLGLNAVFVYGWDAGHGKLIDHGKRIAFPAGAGPRHLALSDDAKHLYVLCELNAQVHVFEQRDDAWAHVQVASTVPEDFTRFADFDYSIGAAIRIAGDTLYVSTRGHNSIAVFPIAGDGRLGQRQLFASGGNTPRDFHVIDGYVIVTNQDSGNLSIFRQGNGEHQLISQVYDLGQPSCVCPF